MSVGSLAGRLEILGAEDIVVAESHHLVDLAEDIRLGHGGRFDKDRRLFRGRERRGGEFEGRSSRRRLLEDKVGNGAGAFGRRSRRLIQLAPVIGRCGHWRNRHGSCRRLLEGDVGKWIGGAGATGSTADSERPAPLPGRRHAGAAWVHGAEQGRHPIDQRLGFERLLDPGISPGSPGLALVERLERSGQQQHRDMLQCRLLLDGGTQLVAVFPGHVDVGQHQVGHQFLGPGIGAVAVVGNGQLVIFMGEGDLDHLLDGNAVIGQQQPFAHGVLLGPPRGGERHSTRQST